ncbi:MAG: hypothetical protein AAF702_51100 [Chloroflexota bacterium]
MTNVATHELSLPELQLIPGIQLAEFDSSSLSKTYRVEMGDGRHFQINEKLYWLLNCLDIPRTLADLRETYAQNTGQAIEMDQLTEISDHLQSKGIISPVGVEPVAPSQEPEDMSAILLGLACRRPLLSANAVAPIAKVFSVFFTKPVAFVGLTIIAIVHILAYWELGYPFNIFMEGVSWPKVYILGLFGILIHEIGHLAACHRFGCNHGPLGVALYFLNPVFYVDVTDAWRLKRWQRVIIDMGGLYLELFLIPVFWALYLWTSDPTYLVLIVISDVWALGNFEPFMKLDGYWLLSDMTGVANLHKRTIEKVQELWQHFRWLNGQRDEPPAPSAFSQWPPIVRRTIWTYVIVSLAIWPVLLVALVPMIYMAFTVYLPMWHDSALVALNAISTFDLSLLGGQIEPLFIPLMSAANMIFVMGLTIRLFWKRWRGSKVEG